MSLRVLPKISFRTQEQRQADFERSLIRRESEIGSQLFGPIPAGHKRDFFCLDERTWVWHEQWKDPATGKQHSITTRYRVRPDGILKSQGGSPMQPVSKTEALNLCQAAEVYGQRVSAEYQRMLETI